LQGKLRTNFRELPMSLAHHLPCHQRATVAGNPGIELLKLVPKLEVTAIQKGCSGMAGMFGVFERNFRTSQRIGAELIREIRQETYQAGTTECSSCRIQMEQDTDKPTVHPLKILARAYGLLPELEDVFDRRGRPGLLS
jgi:Fe-S oxidoreductase